MRRELLEIVTKQNSRNPMITAETKHMTRIQEFFKSELRELEVQLKGDQKASLAWRQPMPKQRDQRTSGPKERRSETGS